jgi:ribosome-binding protein aMBF1 (putative translation factor)
MKYEELKDEFLKSKTVKEAYESEDLPFEMGKRITEARLSKGMTQAQLAKKIGTKQPSIARLENGTSLPNLNFLSKIAKALDTDLILPTFGSSNSSTETKYVAYWVGVPMGKNMQVGCSTKGSNVIK